MKYNSRCTSSIASHCYRLDIWQRNVPWSSVKQMRTVLETEYGIDDIFDGQLHSFAGAPQKSDFYKKLEKDAKAKSEKVKQAYGLDLYPFWVTDQNTLTSLYYREVPLPW